MTPALAARLKKLRAIRYGHKAEIDDAAYRALLMRTAGVTSSTAITRLDQADAVIAEFRRRGIGKPSRPRPVLTPTQKKIWSLWQQLADAGYVHDRSMRGLAAWVKRQTRVDALQFLTAPQEDAVIEALKQWVSRCRGELRSPAEGGRPTDGRTQFAPTSPVT